MTTIQVQQVSKTFQANTGERVAALDNVSLAIASGERLVILGPSGCGKTTLLRVIAGLEQPDTGAIKHNDVRLHEIPEMERGIGMVFQGFALIPHWETARSVGFYLHLRKRDDEIPERVYGVSKITGIGLEKLMARRPKELSEGQKQRIAIARAFARDLNLLLFDEPFASLDAQFRDQARAELLRLLNAYPVTSVFVTHDQVEARSLSQRVVLMDAGKIVQMGTYTELYTEPINQFVAEFMGMQSINIFDGHISESGKWSHPVWGQLPIPTGVRSGQAVRLCARPEHIKMTDDGIPATVTKITPYFVERYYLTEVVSNGTTWSMQVPTEHSLSVGDMLHCQIDVPNAFYFDAQNGVRIR